MSTVAGTRYQPRASDNRTKVWVDPNVLDIPENVVQAFKNSGYGLRWVRHMLGNEADGKNMLLRSREGYEIVTRDEVEQLGWKFPPTVEHSKYGVMISIGDLILAKLPTEISEDRNRQMAEKAQRISQGVNDQLYENAREQRLMPVINNSRTQTTTGGARQVIIDNDDTN